jgi:hypothetical protein
MRNDEDMMAPTRPVEPAEPVQPVQLVEPVQPVQPVQPVRPVEPEYVVPVSGLYRTRQIIYLILGILETLLIIRLVLRLLAANPNAGFSTIIYGVTGPFVAPFQGVFPTPQANGSMLEVAALLAMIVYALLVWAIVRIIEISRTRKPTATM